MAMPGLSLPASHSASTMPIMVRNSAEVSQYHLRKDLAKHCLVIGKKSVHPK